MRPRTNCDGVASASRARLRATLPTQQACHRCRGGPRVKNITCIRKVITSPLAPQPKQWYVPRESSTEKDGLRSSWKGQHPIMPLPEGFISTCLEGRADRRDATRIMASVTGLDGRVQPHHLPRPGPAPTSTTLEEDSTGLPPGPKRAPNWLDSSDGIHARPRGPSFTVPDSPG